MWVVATVVWRSELMAAAGCAIHVVGTQLGTCEIIEM